MANNKEGTGKGISKVYRPTAGVVIETISKIGYTRGITSKVDGEVKVTLSEPDEPGGTVFTPVLVLVFAGKDCFYNIKELHDDGGTVAMSDLQLWW